MFNDFVGQDLDRYRIVQLTDEDSLGAVFRAYDTSLQRDVSIRVIAPALARQPNFEGGFVQAARIAARLDHPNLVQVFDSGEARGVRYIVTEYIPGDHLEQLLDELKSESRWLVLSEALQIVRQMALALEYVRSQGVPQRLAKPANIRIKPDQSEHLPYRPVLVDLDLARLAGEGLGGEPPGSPSASDAAYFSPERALGRPTNARSDVYSLGVLLFELTTGQLPFPIETFEDAVRYHTRQPLPPPRSLWPDMPEPLVEIIVKALEKSPEGRFTDPATLAAELDRLTDLVAEVSSPPPAFESAASLLLPYRQSLEEGPREERLAAAPPAASPQTVPSRAVSERARVEIAIDNAQLSVEPGSTANTVLTLRSLSQAQERFRIRLEGVPAGWVSISPQVVTLRPGESQDTRLTIRPPRSPQSRAGRYPFTLRAAAMQTPGRFAEVKGILTVAFFSRFSSELFTHRLRAGEAGQVGISNQGNAPETFTVNYWDPEGELVFDSSQTQLRLSEGQAGAAEFSATPRQTHWFGSERNYPFNAQVSSSTGEGQRHGGVIASFPLIPGWLLGLSLLLIICAAASAALLLGSSSLQASNATRTAVAMQTHIAQTPEAETATALFLAQANQATLLAATATGEAATAQTATSQVSTALVATAQTATAQEAATQTWVVQQTTQVAAQNAATQTAAALQATQAAAQNASTQTAIALEATQSAGYLAATQTAIALQATQSATSSTATAQAVTATAQMGATQTASAMRSVAYIYLTDINEAKDYQNLLQQDGFEVDLIPEDAILSTDFSLYRAVLLGPQTGSQDTWGDTDGNQANALIASGLPILGMGEGGYAFFGRANLAIGWDHGVTGNGSELYVFDPANPVWSSPNTITIPDNRILKLYNSDSPFVAITIQAPPSDVILIGSDPNDNTHYPLILQGRKYMLWGFARGPSDMSLTGQQVFVNALKSLMP